jgi:hypothetical protein
MSAPTKPPQTYQHRAAHVAAGRVALWTAEWSVGRRIVLFLFGVLQQFFHGGYFRMMLVPGYKWPEPVDPLLFLLTETGGLATSFGLLALPFVKAPNRTIRAVLMVSLTLGALANAARMLSGVYLGDFWFPFVCDSQQRGIPCGDAVDKLITDVGIHVLFGTALYLNFYFFWRLLRAGTRGLAD